VTAINDRKNQQLLQSDYAYQEHLQDLITINQTFRDGLDNIAVAGLQGFKSLKDAAGQVLEQIAELIVKLYIIEPLLDKLFGPAGTAGGGLLGAGLIGGLFSFLGFANGGVFVPGSGRRPLKRFAGGGVSSTAAIFGEAGPEAAIPLPDGHSVPVDLRMPS